MPACSTHLLSALLAVLLIFTPSLHAADWSSVAIKVRPSLAYLAIFDENGMPAGSCTAFSINDEKDYFLTAAHCNMGGYLAVDGYNAYPIYVDLASDLMIVNAPESGDGEYVSLMMTEHVKAGEAVGAYGWGLGLAAPSFEAGDISIVSVKIPQIAKEWQYGTPDETYTVLDFLPAHGMSGGPVFNSKGEVVSIIQIQLPDSLGAGRSLEEIRAKVGKYWAKG